MHSRDHTQAGSGRSTHLLHSHAHVAITSVTPITSSETVVSTTSLGSPPLSLPAAAHCRSHNYSPTLSRFPLALSPKTKRTRSYTSCESTHVTSGVNTQQTPSNLTGIRTMETTAWQLDALSSRDRRGLGRRGLSRRSGRVDILDLHQGR
jgi:hypothetical protein